MGLEPSGQEVTTDALLEGRVLLRQPRRGHRAGTDAVLLAGLADARPGDRVVDLGAASGAVGLMVAARVAIGALTLVERDAALVALGHENITLNGLADRARAMQADVVELALGAERPGDLGGEADLVVMNPPFLEAAGTPASPDPGRRAAHVMAGGGLAAWLAAAARLSTPRGRLCLIHRADRLHECLDALRPSFGSFALVPVHPRAGADAARVVISAVRGGRAPLRLLPPIVLHRPEGGFTPEAAALHGASRDAPAPAHEKGRRSAPDPS